jgi:N-acyl-L-homoserine lactone synthetase
MIYCVNHKTIHYFGEALISQFRLRYQSLIDAQYWNLSRFQGMEYDQYDTPATTYLVWQDNEGVVRGSVRLVPTDRPYMIKEIWPDLIETVPLPQSLSVWEATRFCIDKSVPYEQRQRIKHELVLAFVEFGLRNDIREMVGTMPPKLWDSVFVKSGWDITYLGKVKDLGKDGLIIAGLMPVSLEVLEKVRKTTGIQHPVLLMAPENQNENPNIVLQMPNRQAAAVQIREAQMKEVQMREAQ